MEAVLIVGVIVIIFIWAIKGLYSNRMEDLKQHQEDELDKVLEAQRVKRQIDNEIANDPVHAQRMRDKYEAEDNQ